MVQSALPNRTARPVTRVPFAKLASGVTFGTVLVVLFGAVVRVTGSGAGCGQHWPTCHGEIAHLPRSVETWIELGHRTTSGLNLLAVLALAAVAWQRFPARHPARLAASAALALILIEAAIGARLVLLSLVGSNMSLDRALVMPAHLITTSFLIGTLAAASYFGSAARLRVSPEQPPQARAKLRHALGWILLAALLLLLVSMSGAVTALGDTVYPVQGKTTLEHLRNDQAEGAHFLGKLRVVHPLLALFGVASLWIAASRARAASSAPLIQRTGWLLYVGGGLALAIGSVNVALGAPGYLQIVHLAMACGLWLASVLLASALWDAQTRTGAVES